MPTATAVTERPILFSGPMVRAILEGRKTQTRRVVKPQPDCETAKVWFNVNTQQFDFRHCSPWFSLTCPYGLPGDRLWVRETFAAWRGGAADKLGMISGVIYKSDSEQDWNETLFDKAVIDARRKQGGVPAHIGNWKSYPSIFMPRWASRITLEIVKVRVERVQDISEQDAIAEGIQREELGYDPDNFHPPGSYGYVSGLHPFPKGMIWPRAAEAYKELWDSINEKRGFGWDKNPWVWLVEFKRLEGTNL